MYEGTPKSENNTEKPQIKEGVDFIFEQNPELSSVGTKEQYSQYLETIFPKSPYRKIVFHGTNEKYQTFDDTLIGKNTAHDLIDYYGKRIHFSITPNTGHGEHIITALINPREELGEYPTDNSYEDPKVETSEQIHILGSATDLEKFKEFVG